MNVLAYVIAVLNPLLLNSRDIAFRLGPLHSLSDEVKQIKNFPQEALRDGYHRFGNKGLYLSNNLRDFIFNGKGEGEEEGFIVTLDFEAKNLDPPDADPIAYVLHRPGFTDSQIKKADEDIKNLIVNRRNYRSLNSVKLLLE